MKKSLSLLLALAMAVSLAACGSQNAGIPPADDPPAVTTPGAAPDAADQSSDPAETPDTAAPSASGESGGILIAYFGVPETDGVDTVANASRVATADGVVGNCEFIAQAIQEAVGGDLFAIETVQEYPSTHGALLDFAYQELRQNARPELSSEIENLDDYDVIFLGYPIWWDEAPAMIATFLAENDFEGKIIAPFCTSAYSPISNSLHIFRELAPGAELADGLTANDLDLVQAWVDEVLEQAA